MKIVYLLPVLTSGAAVLANSGKDFGTKSGKSTSVMYAKCETPALGVNCKSQPTDFNIPSVYGVAFPMNLSSDPLKGWNYLRTPNGDVLRFGDGKTVNKVKASYSSNIIANAL